MAKVAGYNSLQNQLYVYIQIAIGNLNKNKIYNSIKNMKFLGINLTNICMTLKLENIAERVQKKTQRSEKI